MTTTTNYFNAAQTYAEGVRAFFAGGPAVVAERAGPGPAPIPELVNRAETLAPQSAQLTSVAAAQLAAAEPALRQQAAIGLLAKTLTDLEVSKVLFNVAEAGDTAAQRSFGAAERSTIVTRPAHLDDTLALLLDAASTRAALVERGTDRPTTVAAAKTQLAGSTETTLLLIRDRAVDTGWEALSGVAGLGAGQLAEAVGLVSMEVAEALGQAAQLTRLYGLAREFLSNAYTALQTLLGPALTQLIGAQVAGWCKEATSDKKFARLVEKLYATAATNKALAKLSTESAVDLPHYLAAIDGIDALEVAYRHQIEIVKKILKTFKFVAIVPALALPHGRLLMAAAYILVGGYIVLAGGDYVDAQQLKLLDRVPGVRKIVEANLAST